MNLKLKVGQLFVRVKDSRLLKVVKRTSKHVIAVNPIQSKGDEHFIVLFDESIVDFKELVRVHGI